MTRIADTLRAIAAQLDATGCRWALIGGLAVGARSEPRTTRDVDIAVGVDGDADAEALIFSLTRAGYRVASALEQTAVGRLATARLLPPGHGPRGVVLDLLFASSGIEPEITAAAERLELIAGLQVPVASLAHLIALKVLARDDRRRPRDAGDLAALLAEAGDGDRRAAADALRLIAARGYDRGKDLQAELQRAIVDLS